MKLSSGKFAWIYSYIPVCFVPQGCCEAQSDVFLQLILPGILTIQLLEYCRTLRMHEYNAARNQWILTPKIGCKSTNPETRKHLNDDLLSANHLLLSRRSIIYSRIINGWRCEISLRWFRRTIRSTCIFMFKKLSILRHQITAGFRKSLGTCLFAAGYGLCTNDNTFISRTSLTWLLLSSLNNWWACLQNGVSLNSLFHATFKLISLRCIGHSRPFVCLSIYVPATRWIVMNNAQLPQWDSHNDYS